MFGLGNWSALIRFAVLQKGKYRCIDDGSHGHNDTFESSETIHTTSAAAAAIATRRARQIFGCRLRRSLRFLTGSSDMKRAYKQLAVHPDQHKYIVICIFNPELNKWVFAISWALPFGMSGAVLHFNRVPAFIVALCRRWMAIPVQNFFDDFRIVEPTSLEGSGFKWFKKITQLLGLGI